MRLYRQDKEKLVSEMNESLANAKTVVLVNYQGLKVKEIYELKKKLFEQGIKFQIVKNTLLKIALKNSGITANNEALKQPVAAVWGFEDEIVPAKLTVEFMKLAEKLQLVGGIVNKNYVEASTIKQLASLPGREELYAKLVGTLNAPMYRLVNVLQGNLRSLVYILSEYAKSKA